MPQKSVIFNVRGNLYIRPVPQPRKGGKAMESKARTVAKALSWQGLGLITMTLIGYLFTGSVGAGGTMAVVASLTGFVCYIAHESAWNRVRWGRRL
jgi:uncharacterized membrane protein